MRSTELTGVITSVFSDNKGVLAIDESIRTCNKRFAALQIPPEIEYRRAYRELVMTVPGLNESIGGVILCDETMRQSKGDGQSFLNLLEEIRIVPGIKVDTGANPLDGCPGERLTSGLDNLRTRLDEYRSMGARFAKWRAVFAISEELPTSACIRKNCQALAKYALICQQAGLVPIVEPEVLGTGTHSMELCSEATERVLLAVFHELCAVGASYEEMVLKPNMVVPGLTSLEPESSGAIADATVSCLESSTSHNVPVIAFLSGGQSGRQASERLNAMNLLDPSRRPWALAFSFGRAIQEPALSIWRGRSANSHTAQAALYHRATCNASARSGTYISQSENEWETATVSSATLGNQKGFA